MDAKFTADEMVEFRRVFKTFDRNGSGDITVSDLTAVMNDLGAHVTSEEVKEILHHADASGRISFESFLSLVERSRTSVGRWSQEERKKKAELEMRQAFKVFDRDGNGLIDKHELKTTMKSLGENLSTTDIKAMIKAADKNGDGKIDYEEFIKMMYPNT